MIIIPAQPGWYVPYSVSLDGTDVTKEKLPVVAWGIDEDGDGGRVYVLTHDKSGEPTIGPLSAGKVPGLYGVFHDDHRVDAEQ
jgi:hypothetical protein